MDRIIGVREVSKIYFYQALLAEFLGTVIMVFFGVSTFSVYGEVSDVQTSLCFGLTTASLVMAFGHISGANLNPAVTLGLMCCQIVPLVRGSLYIIMQMAGAVVGSGLIYAIKAREDTLFGVTFLPPGRNPAEGFLIEVIGTMIIVLVYLTVSCPKRTGLKNMGFFLIGIAVTAAHLAAYHFTRAGLNPARSFGTVVVNRESACKDVCWKHHWIFWFGPLLGGFIAAVLHKILLNPRKIQDGESYYQHDWC